MLVMRKTVVISFIIVFTITGLYFLRHLFFDPLDLGQCDGNGPPNGERKYYHPNGQLHEVGSVKNCLWDGLVKTFYETGELERIARYQTGQKHGLTEYFTPDGIRWRAENFVNDSVIDFQVTDLADNSVFSFQNDTLRLLTASQKDFIVFSKPTTLYGNDEPFTGLQNGKLLMRGSQDFYLINKKLVIEMSLRDTLMKYIPSAYLEKIDESGNKHNFYWHRNISGDTLKLKVFYGGDNHQSNHKVWERTYPLTRVF